MLVSPQTTGKVFISYLYYERSGDYKTLLSSLSRHALLYGMLSTARVCSNPRAFEQYFQTTQQEVETILGEVILEKLMGTQAEDSLEEVDVWFVDRARK